MTPIDFHVAVMNLATRFQFSITSSHRTKKRNIDVGGDPNSRHLSFGAIDAVLDDWSDRDAFVAEARRAGLVAVFEGDHVHLQIP